MTNAEGTGFNFDLCRRNDFLEQMGMKAPGHLKTGTTIAGVIFKVRLGGRLRSRRSLSPIWKGSHRILTSYDTS